MLFEFAGCFDSCRTVLTVVGVICIVGIISVYFVGLDGAQVLFYPLLGGFLFVSRETFQKR